MVKRRAAGSETLIAAAWRASRAGLFVLVLFSTCINVLRFATPLYLLQVLDRVPVSRSVETLVMLTAVVLAALVTRVALDVVRRRMLTRWGIWVEWQFGPRLLSQRLADQSRSSSSDADDPLADLGRIRSFISSSLAAWLDVVWMPVFLLGVFLVDVVLGLVAALGLGLLVLIALWQDSATREPRRVSRVASREAGQIVTEAERNKESVGALAMAQSLTERWRQSAQGRLSERERIEGHEASFGALRSVVGDVLRIAMIAIGVLLVIRGSETLGGIFAARVMGGSAYRLTERAVRNLRPLREASQAYGNLKQRLLNENGRPTSILPGTTQAPLVLDGVTFRYSGQRTDLFRRFSLQLAPGELLLVTGPAATGKTSLSRLIVGLLDPKYGQIRLGDVEITRLPADLRSEIIGYLPQHTELFNGTVRENIARMSEGALDVVVAAAELVGIHDRIVRLPSGYDTLIGPNPQGLSGSERKRIALARAFFGSPRLIVLDEPTANLDPASRRILGAALAQLKSRGCSIIVTQAGKSASLARVADKLLILGGERLEVTQAADGEAGPSKPKAFGLRSVK